MPRNSDALNRVLSVPDAEKAMIFLSVGQLQKLIEFEQYEGDKPDGLFFMLGHNGSGKNTIEIIPYTNDLENDDPNAPSLKYFSFGYVKGPLRAKLGYPIPSRPDFGENLVIENGPVDGGGDGSSQKTPPGR